MKIVNRNEFLMMPKNTVFQKYTPCIIESHISIKGENCGDNDFWSQPLDAVGASTNNWAHDPTEIDLHSEIRDGEFDDDQMFLIWEKTEVHDLIIRLMETLNS